MLVTFDQKSAQNSSDMNTRYLNVDCILASFQPLDEILILLEGDSFVLWNEFVEEEFVVGLETNLVNTSGPEEDIGEFLRLFETKSPGILDLLSGCHKKIFDIGFESDGTGTAAIVNICSLILEKVSAAGFEIRISVYPIKPHPDRTP